jgi:hypothetical protein
MNSIRVIRDIRGRDRVLQTKDCSGARLRLFESAFIGVHLRFLDVYEFDTTRQISKL